MKIKNILLATLCSTLVDASNNTGDRLFEEALLTDPLSCTFVSKPMLIFRENKESNSNGRAYWNVDVIVATESLLEGSIKISFNMNGSDLTSSVLYAEPGNDRIKAKQFFKTSFALQRRAEQYLQSYSLNLNQNTICTNNITVPGLNEELRFITTSCNGFDDPKNETLIGTKEKVWHQILENHKTRHNHLMIGLGDQLYCDEVFNLNELQPWLSKKFSVEEFNSIEPTEGVTEAVDHFYFHRYLDEFSKNTPSFSECLSNIPQMNIWDDHEIFDGYGSLPRLLQNSPMVQMIGRIAKKYYLLFQQGVNPKLTNEQAVAQGFLSNNNYSFFKTVGNTTFMGMDTRSERDLQNVMAPSSFKALLEDLDQYVTDATKHLVVLSATPIINPDLRFASNVLWYFANPYACKTRLFRHMAQWIATKIGTLDVLGNDFTSNNFDFDQWISHASNKTMLIERLQHIGKTKNVLVKILAGDIHCGGLAKIEQNTDSNSNALSPIWQLTTSPAGNVPTNMVSSLYARYMEYKAFKNNDSKTSNEKFLTWQGDQSLPRFMQRRNWLQVSIGTGDTFYAQLNTEIPNSAPPGFEPFVFRP